MGDRLEDTWEIALGKEEMGKDQGLVADSWREKSKKDMAEFESERGPSWKAVGIIYKETSKGVLSRSEIMTYQQKSISAPFLPRILPFLHYYHWSNGSMILLACSLLFILP